MPYPQDPDKAVSIGELQPLDRRRLPVGVHEHGQFAVSFAERIGGTGLHVGGQEDARDVCSQRLSTKTIIIRIL